MGRKRENEREDGRASVIATKSERPGEEAKNSEKRVGHLVGVQSVVKVESASNSGRGF